MLINVSYLIVTFIMVIPPPQRAAPETSEQPVDVEMGSENDSADEIDTDDGDNAMYVLSFRYECACSC